MQQPQATIPWTQASITALSNALASGVRSVSYEGRIVTYASLADMQRLLDRMVRAVNNQGDGVPPPNTRGSVFFTR